MYNTVIGGPQGNNTEVYTARQERNTEIAFYFLFLQEETEKPKQEAVTAMKDRHPKETVTWIINKT